jgi:hypothetical protein
LLHLERMAAIRAVEDHPIERVNGGFGPEAAIMLIAVKVRFGRITAVGSGRSESPLRAQSGWFQMVVEVNIAP